MERKHYLSSIITFENKENRLVPPDKFSYNYNNIDLENTSIIFKSVKVSYLINIIWTIHHSFEGSRSK